MGPRRADVADLENDGPSDRGAHAAVDRGNEADRGRLVVELDLSEVDPLAVAVEGATADDRPARRNRVEDARREGAEWDALELERAILLRCCVNVLRLPRSSVTSAPNAGVVALARTTRPETVPLGWTWTSICAVSPGATLPEAVPNRWKLPVHARSDATNETARTSGKRNLPRLGTSIV